MLGSGTGNIGWVELGASEGQFHVFAFCPGFVRGLAFFGKYAFGGLSKPRYQRFEGLGLNGKLVETTRSPGAASRSSISTLAPECIGSHRWGPVVNGSGCAAQ